ncbi:hypothetical protein GSF24_12310 [Microbispora triticiradicis]|nr:hypothetical protein [Microbispora triticiradicis]
MAIALNLTAPLKQDPESQQRLGQLVATFADQVQPAVDNALAKSGTVHFARVLVIDNKYIQILTEFDGDTMQYTEFFRRELGEIFRVIFSLVEGAPPWEELNNPNSFFEYTHRLNLPCLGEATAGNDGRGYLFSALGDMTIREIRSRLGE